MKNVEDIFKEDIRTYGRQLDYKIKVNDELVNTDDFNYIKPSFNANLFKTIMHAVKIDSKYKLNNKDKINIEAGLKVNELAYNYINYNSYYVHTCEREEDTSSYTILAYDKMIESMIDYDLDSYGKIKLRDYLIKICERLSWNTENIPAVFVNSEKLVDNFLHTGIGYTFRDALDEIATLSCSALLFINDGFYLKYPEETNQNIDESYLSEDSIHIGEKYFINSLVFARAEESDNIFRKDNDSIQKNGLSEYRIEDNQLLSTNDRDLYIDEMFNYLKTFEFYTFDVKTKGILFLEAYDKFNFVLDEKTYSTILLNDEISFEDGLTEDIYVDLPKETETDYKYSDETDKKINQAYILVDKQNRKIELLTSEINNSNEKISKFEQDINFISTKVENIADVTQEIAGIKKITIPDAVEGELLELHIDGNNTVFKHTYVSKQTLVSENTKLQGDSLIKVYTRNICPTKVTEWENGYFAGKTGEKWDSLEYIRNKEKIKIEPGKKVTFSLNNEEYLWSYVYLYDFANRYIGGIQATNNQEEITITIPEKASYINVMIKKNEAQQISPNEIIDIKPQIEYGERKTDFIQCNTQLIDLGIKNVLRQKEEIRDTYDLVGADAILTRRINKDNEILLEPEIEVLQRPSIFLVTGENFIEIKNYTANLSCKYAKQNEFTDIYATKVEMNSKIEQTAQQIRIEVNKKVDEEQMTSAISQTAKEINLEVSKKVGDDEIISKINQSAEEIQIDANKISLVGKEINLTGDNMIIKSNNFNVNKNGDATVNNINIKSGKIQLQDGTEQNANFEIISTKNNKKTIITPGSIYPSEGIFINKLNGTGQSAYLYMSESGNAGIQLNGNNSYIRMLTEDSDVSGNASIRCGGYMYAKDFLNISSEKIKKNIKKLDIEILDLIKNADIYSYNLKTETDLDKKHIGFVIGERYQTPKEVLDKNEEAVDLYSMCSILWKAVQELSEKIEKLEGKGE